MANKQFSITTYEQLLEELKLIADTNILTDDMYIRDAIGNFTSCFVSHPINYALHLHLFTAKGKTTIGDIISDVLLHRPTLLYPEFILPKGKGMTSTPFEVSKTFNERFGQVLSLLKTHPAVANQTVNINMSKFVDEHIIPDHMEFIYKFLIGDMHPEKYNDIEAFKCKADDVFIQITAIRKQNNSKEIKYTISLYHPGDADEIFNIVLSSVDKGLENYNKIQLLDAEITESLRIRHLI